MKTFIMPDLKSQISNLKSDYAVIVAGGTGSRMQSALPKQFIEIYGQPVLMHTIRAFFESSAAPQIILALNSNYHDLWAELCQRHSFTIPHTVIAGGETRFHSVKNALEIITEANAIVAVHDAVRPLTSKQTIEESFRVAASNGTAVTAVKSRDSIRQLNGDISACLNRDEIYLVQTPQTFRASVLKEAYEQPYTSLFTDDASVVEKAGYRINLIKGDHSNIKITFPEDVIIAEALLSKKAIN
ncbi:2-C-methyl-D-erythritol 4-phosphate cytidylyltransferase [Mucilaginibacter achroorhodeus]|nr:2-C-methyl-D-erythritol 4-phosphate cytidylyltransferase [Mucilaginibacter achroorhodeus]